MKRDVVIIGGSLAGAACVRELVKWGIDALALERDRFPRKKVCGGFLSPGAVECLEYLGVLDDVRAAGAVQITSARIQAGSADMQVQFDRPGLGISRAALDHVLACRAPVVQGTPVREVR